ncbi:ABC transporter substrate-binding protein [Microbacterium plantarum]|uniref:ABC transporter substrate-binding protein n=1 Tax=Microbacterium plantarum TaxID=1816425 RepID=UPI002B4592C9|nr:ABC transporter substrate-binding protein [Microbacterium plantarum]WRK17124.1 ABC transporter substrate-binding protein [Microbacterium plantarum]
MKRHVITLAGLATVAALALSSCSGGGPASTDENPSGEITVLTNRTDIVDTVFADYVTEFQKTYPDVQVKFEALTDYEGDVRIRLNSRDYGDVLLIPTSNVTRDQYPEFFEPLGDEDELSETYRFISDATYDGTVYGLSTFGSAMGYVFNRDVWTAAGITTPPATEAEYLDALQAIKDTGVIPYYTNYSDGWPLSSLAGNIGGVTGPSALNDMQTDNAPWSEGVDIYEIDSLLYDTVAAGLSEPDPTTTNWEESKTLLANGEIGSMVLGSWAVSQMQDAAEAVGKSRDTIGFWPMPWQTDGQFTSVTATDKLLAVSKYSDNKPAAKAWLNWFENESGFAESQGAISPIKADDAPVTLSDFTDLGVQYIELDPRPEGEESRITDIANSAEITLFGEQYRQQIIDTARGARAGDKESFFADLNSRWGQAVSDTQ